MKKKIIFASLLVVLIVLFGSSETPGFHWKPGVQNPTLTIGNSNIAVEIADTDSARVQGLSGRSSLGENKGMLFIFDTAGYHSFWMKGMKFPIDIIWLDDNRRVIDLTANANPNDFPKIYQPHLPVRHVLEVNSGFISTHQITIGAPAVLQLSP